MAAFDRVRPRDARAPVAPAPPAVTALRPRDSEGRSALFSTSAAPDAPAAGFVTLTCSSCHQSTAMSPVQLLKVAVPSVHFPLLNWRHTSWMRCPACRRRTWVRLAVQVPFMRRRGPAGG
jgi:hypothetical protein